MPAHRVVTVVQGGGLLLDLAIPVHVFEYHGGGRHRHALGGGAGRSWSVLASAWSATAARFGRCDWSTAG